MIIEHCTDTLVFVKDHQAVHLEVTLPAEPLEEMILPKRFQVTDLLLIYGGDAIGAELRVVVAVPFQREFCLEVVAFVESTGQLSHLIDTIDSHFIKGLQS